MIKQIPVIIIQLDIFQSLVCIFWHERPLLFARELIEQLRIVPLNFLNLLNLLVCKTLTALILSDESLKLSGRVPFESILFTFQDLIEALLKLLFSLLLSNLGQISDHFLKSFFWIDILMGVNWKIWGQFWSLVPYIITNHTFGHLAVVLMIFYLDIALLNFPLGFICIFKSPSIFFLERSTVPLYCIELSRCHTSIFTFSNVWNYFFLILVIFGNFELTWSWFTCDSSLSSLWSSMSVIVFNNLVKFFIFILMALI